MNGWWKITGESGQTLALVLVIGSRVAVVTNSAFASIGESWAIRRAALMAAYDVVLDHL